MLLFMYFVHTHRLLEIKITILWRPQYKISSQEPHWKPPTKHTSRQQCSAHKYMQTHLNHTKKRAPTLILTLSTWYWSLVFIALDLGKIQVVVLDIFRFFACFYHINYIQLQGKLY
jgi:hypothetical protein